MKLDFVCIGAQKAGTTKVHDVLKMHNSIFLPLEKEAHFFEIEERYEKGLEYFFNTFYSDYKGRESVVGLVDPNLQLDILYVKRILEAFTDVKILFILRNPVERAYSHYKMSKLRGIEPYDFITALEQENIRMKHPENLHKGYKTKVKGHFEKNHFSYVKRGLYYEILKYLKQNVSPKNYKIILFEDFISNLDLSMKEICTFLDVSHFEFEIDRKKSNPTKEERFHGLNSFLRNSYVISRLKKWFPINTRRSIKKSITKINSRIPTNNEDIPISAKKKIFDKYFKNEVDRIEREFELNLNSWKY